MSIKVTIFKMIDFDILGDTSHVSISGGVATHELREIKGFTADTIEEAMNSIIEQYGTPFIFDDRLELNISESETLSFYFEKTESVEISEIKVMFPSLEEY